MGEAQCRPLEFWRWPCHLEPHSIHLFKIEKIVLDMLLSPGGQNAWPWDSRYQSYSWVGLFVVAVIQSPSCVRLFVTWWTAACQASLPELAQTHVHWVSDAIQPIRPLSFSFLLPSLFPSIRGFSESVLCIRWPNYWSFSFSISSSNEYSGLISFRIDWLDLLAVQRTLKSLFQPHSSKASIFWLSAFLMI